jgi:ribonuclease BN (tRNA processing enzyme)
LIILDAGTGIRRLGHYLTHLGPVSGTLLFTHAHWDHISGFPFFSPLHLPTTRLAVACCAFKSDFVSKMLAATMAAPYFPLPLAKVKAAIEYPALCAGSFEVGGLRVETIPLCHPNGGVGYKFTEAGRSLVFLTDNELHHFHPNGRALEEYRRFCQGVDLLIHDAEYTPEEYDQVKGYGHSSYLHALDLALAAEVKAFALFHHNQERTDDQVDALVAHCRQVVTQRRGAAVQVLALGVGQIVTV